ncbi:MAG: DUF6069 family protein [Bdellovibrionota bacterium]|nr:DUF6069 family protein [Bdellovibrionota bacterium]
MEGKEPKVGKFLLGGLLAGFLGALVNNIYSFLYTSITGFSIPKVIHVGSITSASILLVVISSLFYFLLEKFTSKARLIYIIVGVIFLILSFLGPLSSHLPDGTPTPEGFAGLALPMHIISGLLAFILIPWHVDRKEDL